MGRLSSWAEIENVIRNHPAVRNCPILLCKYQPSELKHNEMAWKTARQYGEFIIFVKAEIFASIEAPRLLNSLLNHLYRSNIGLVAMSYWDGHAMSEHALIERCYLPLSTITRQGVKALRSHQIAALRNVPIYGAYAFLEAYPDIDPAKLAEIIAQEGTIKLGAGAYATLTQIDQKQIVLLNGFYPYQLHHLCGPDALLLAFACRSETPLPIVRSRVIGDIHPEFSAPGSFRHWLNSAANDFLPSVMLNGVHISPGSFEGAFHVNLFFPSKKENFQVNCDETVFARTLRTAINKKADRVLSLSPDNPDDAINLIDIFEKTEGKSKQQAIEIIGSIL